MNKAEFVRVWHFLSAAFAKAGGNKLSEVDERERMEAYFVALQDLPPDLLKAAALTCVGRNIWFPAVAELRAAAYDLMAQADGLPTPTEAWAEVKRNTGAWEQSWSHPLVKRALDMIGERDWAMSDIESEPSWRKWYIETYSSLIRRQQDQAMMLPEVRKVIGRLSDGRRKELEAGT